MGALVYDLDLDNHEKNDMIAGNLMNEVSDYNIDDDIGDVNASVSNLYAVLSPLFSVNVDDDEPSTGI